MDFVKSHFFTNETLTSCPFFHAKANPTKSDKKKRKKGATGQSFIRKEVTSYKIHTLEQWQSWKFETEKDLTSIKSLELHDSILWLEVHSLDNKYTCTLMPLFYWRNFSPKDFAMIFMYFLPVKTRGNMVLPTFISNLVMFLLWFLLSWELRVSSRVFCNCTV